MMAGNTRFLPWVRMGAATAIQRPDSLGPTLPGAPNVPLSFRINQRNDAQIDVPLQFLGPGDVTGIDADVVIRTDPPPQASNFEPNYFPAIEFDRPDFPWLFTPATGDGQARLRPWICLVVVRRQPGVRLSAGAPGLPPVLTIEAPARPAAELPDLGETWAWAHAQVVHGEGSPALEPLLTQDSAQSLSRLLCPRRLTPEERYLACLVPAFEAGRLAGLGLPVSEADRTTLRPAWDSGALAPPRLDLPVYFHWEFRTGAAGDFESLAGELRARRPPPGVGAQTIDARDVGFGLPALGDLTLEGALRLPIPADHTSSPPPAFQQALRDLLNLPARSASGDSDADPLVAPPIYGGWHAAQSTVPESGDPPVWLRELNLDVRFRAIAGLGVQVIQAQQEQLMASAWDQAGDLTRVLVVRTRAKLATLVLQGILDKRMATMGPAQLLQFTRPIHKRTLLESQTVHQRIQQSTLPAARVSPAFQRIARPRGPIGRRIGGAGGPPVPPHALLTTLATDPQVVAPAAAAPPPLVSPVTVRRHVGELRTRLAIAEDAGEQTDGLRRFLAAADRVADYFEAPDPPRPPTPKPFDLNRFKSFFVNEANIGALVTARVEAQINTGRKDSSPGVDPVDEAMAVPTFPQPMYEALRDVAPQLLLPGVDQILDNTVMLLATNTAFVKAFMVGLNHEMSRELLWREFPGERLRTFFRRFWGTGGRATGNGAPQLPPIESWPTGSTLDQPLIDADGAENLVLLIRGQLLGRFPNTIIYAVKAASQRRLGTQERYPVFRAQLEPDITVLGFDDLTVDEARGGNSQAGWFFVIQEQPTAPRFGLDVTPSTPPLSAWTDLAWTDVAIGEGGHLQVVASQPEVNDTRFTWGLNGAHMAAITHQVPARVAIHARLLLDVKEEA